MKEIAIFTTRDSELVFYELLANNSEVQIKQLCRKVPRKMLYKYLRQLGQIQEASGVDIFQRSAGICGITGLPNVVIQRKCCISVDKLAGGSFLVNFFEHPIELKPCH